MAIVATGQTPPVEGKALVIDEVCKTYQSHSGDSVEALHPLSLEISPGEFLVIVGPSGCGKSTLLKMLAGFETPSGGQLFVDGQIIAAPDPDRGMVFQSYALFPWLSVEDNVAFGLECQGRSRRDREPIVAEYLKLVGLSEFAQKRVSELSGGMKQRVAIARTFAVQPSVVFMDEPFGALDALTRRFLQGELLRIWREHKKTIVFITHSVPEAVTLADRILVMTARPGRLKQIVSVDLPHPRDSTSNEFRSLERRIYQELDEELARSFAAEGAGSN
ncbi:MAG: ABC transporter ATP-binding protein [Burkholderiaceae bacterium]